MVLYGMIPMGLLIPVPGMLNMHAVPAAGTHMSLLKHAAVVVVEIHNLTVHQHQLRNRQKHPHLQIFPFLPTHQVPAMQQDLARTSFSIFILTGSVGMTYHSVS